MAEESDKKLLTATSKLVAVIDELKKQLKGSKPSGDKGKAPAPKKPPILKSLTDGPKTPTPKKPPIDPTRKQFKTTENVAIQKFSDKSLMRLADAVKGDEAPEDEKAKYLAIETHKRTFMVEKINRSRTSYFWWYSIICLWSVL